VAEAFVPVGSAGSRLGKEKIGDFFLLLREANVCGFFFQSKVCGWEVGFFYAWDPQLKC
jgi:hypothetical protein